MLKIMTLINITTYIFIYNMILTPLIQMSGSVPGHVDKKNLTKNKKWIWKWGNLHISRLVLGREVNQILLTLQGVKFTFFASLTITPKTIVSIALFVVILFVQVGSWFSVVEFSCYSTL
jgi:hypothetical protein